MTNGIAELQDLVNKLKFLEHECQEKILKAKAQLDIIIPLKLQAEISLDKVRKENG